ncbi:hypothetical protein MRX96_039243 [Rhipicephalus microplus]
MRAFCSLRNETAEPAEIQGPAARHRECVKVGVRSRAWQRHTPSSVDESIRLGEVGNYQGPERYNARPLGEEAPVRGRDLSK